MYFLATLLYKSVPFFTKFSVAKKIFPKTKTKSRLYRCLTLFCFTFVKHMFLEKKLFSSGNCMLVKICFDILKPKFCVTLFCFCSTFMPKPFSFSVLMFNVFVPFFFVEVRNKKKMNPFVFIQIGVNPVKHFFNFFIYSQRKTS